MKPFLLTLAAASVAAPVYAQETRGMDAHVHGVSTAEVAVEHGKLEINLLSPGMDIVGFEYEAMSPEDKDAVEAAIRQFLLPEEIVTLPGAAGCRLTEVLAHLHSGDHEEEHEDEHDHEDDHADEHAEHDATAGAEHDDHDHEEQAEGVEHSAFHVTYAYSCDDEDALTSIEFPFFDRFENAREIEVQYVTETGAGTAELTPGAPGLSFE